MGIPPIYTYQPFDLASFNTINSLAEKIARDWLNIRRGASTLFVTGVNGSGKSSYAVAMIRMVKARYPASRIRFVTPVVFSDVTKGMVEDSGKGDIYNQWFELNPIVLDDIGAVRDTPHVTEKLVHLMMKRHEEIKKTIVTTNLTVAQFAEYVDPRIASRLQQGMMIDMGKVDLRKKNMRDWT